LSHEQENLQPGLEQRAQTSSRGVRIGETEAHFFIVEHKRAYLKEACAPDIDDSFRISCGVVDAALHEYRSGESTGLGQSAGIYLHRV
jgi:hypothetical protein